MWDLISYGQIYFTKPRLSVLRELKIKPPLSNKTLVYLDSWPLPGRNFSLLFSCLFHGVQKTV